MLFEQPKDAHALHGLERCAWGRLVRGETDAGPNDVHQYESDDDTYERYIGYDINLEEASGETHHVLPAPSTFIIGTNGIINFQYTNPDYKVRLHPDVLLAAARAYVNEADQRLYRAWKARMKKQQK